jgi:hypothetical protein
MVSVDGSTDLQKLAKQIIEQDNIIPISKKERLLECLKRRVC